MKKILFLLFLCQTIFGLAQKQTPEYNLKKDISYASYNETDSYAKERCKLDLYYPDGEKNFPTIIWFHGGGLTSGEKYIPQELKEQKMAVVAVNYRLSPKATCPSYIQDAAASINWVFNNIEKYGGSTKKIFVAGHSAGGWLTLMLSLDKKYLNTYSLDTDRVSAWFSISGQTMTHYTVREEKGIDRGLPMIDKYSPCYNIRKSNSPIILITGDRNLELPSRYEENLYLFSLLRNIGNSDIRLYELNGFDHGNVYKPACIMMVNYINKLFDK